MATDVEESDTDEHERPAPPKRQCTRLVNSNEGYESLNQRLGEAEERTSNSEQCEYDEVEKLAREKLTRWQECQVTKGCLDNTVNRVIENYMIGVPVTYPADASQFRLFGNTDMEDTAVLMAIRNHGLVNSADMEPRVVCASSHFGRCSDEEHPEVLRHCPTNRLQEAAELSTVALPSSSAIFQSRSADDERRLAVGLTDDEKMDESDREQDFLERAVAEAIKKKGLTALSVDDG